jgi:hypothetical protein
VSTALRGSGSGGEGREAPARNGGGLPGGGRRRDRQGGLRWLFNSLRTSDGPVPSGGSNLQVGGAGGALTTAGLGLALKGACLLLTAT